MVLVSCVGITSQESRVFKKFFSKKFLIKSYPETINEQLLAKIKNTEVLTTHIYSKINKQVLDKLPNLKLIVTRTTGYDHIDLVACKKKGVVVCNVPSYGENTVAEHTFALILNLSRNVHKSYLRTINGNYNKDDLQGFDLKGKTIGVIGAGHIGMHVIKIAKGFGMHVLAYDLFKNDFLSDLLHFNYASLDEIYKKADIISLHVPFNEHTNHLINAKAISKMKKGVIIVNTSRGGVIDTGALYNALIKEKVGGVGLDVIEGEEIVMEDNLLKDPDNIKGSNWKLLAEDLKLLKLDNVLFTPHNAFNSKEATKRRLQVSADDILGFYKGKVINQVN